MAGRRIDDGDLVCECEVEQLIDTEGPGTTTMLIESHERGFVAKVPLIAERLLLSLQYDVPHQMICGAQHTKPSCSSPRATPCPWTTASPSSPKTRPPSQPRRPRPAPPVRQWLRRPWPHVLLAGLPEDLAGCP